MGSSWERTSYFPLYFWWNVILLLLNQRKPGLTMLFLSAFWIVYPVMAAFPSSFGGVHDRATFSPQTSSIFTSWGGPGRSTGLIHSITGRSLSLPTYALLQEGISKHPSLPASLPTFLVPFLNFREVKCTLTKLIWKLLILIFLGGKKDFEKKIKMKSQTLLTTPPGQPTGIESQG